MAAGTPSIIYPTNGETGIRLAHVLLALKAPYSGAGTQREVRWQVSTTNSFPATTALVWDSGLRENDDHALGDDWVEVPLPLLAASATTYYLSCLVRNTSDESSSWATAVSFATETGLTTAVWEAAQ